MKRCNTCQIQKQFDQFYKRKDAYKDPYRSDCKECWSAKAGRRYDKDPGKFHERDKRWRLANPEKEKARGKKYRELHKTEWSIKSVNWQKNNPGRVAAIKRAFNQRYPERINAQNALRKAQQLRATPQWLSQQHHEQIRAFYRHAIALSKQTWIEHHVDHIIPLRGKRVRGLHVPWNLQVITATENHKKNNRFD